MIICVDIDDTIEDLLPVWIQKLNKKYDRNVSLSDINEWHLSKFFPGLSREEILQPLYSEDIWRSVKPKKNAPEILQRLITEGHDVYLVTNSHYKSLEAKIDNMLSIYFPFIDLRHLIVTAHKQMIKCDVMIDDYYGNLQGGDYIKFLFNTNYNKDFDETEESNMYRVSDWDQIYQLLGNISELSV